MERMEAPLLSNIICLFLCSAAIAAAVPVLEPPLSLSLSVAAGLAFVPSPHRRGEALSSSESSACLSLSSWPRPYHPFCFRATDGFGGGEDAMTALRMSRRSRSYDDDAEEENDRYYNNDEEDEDDDDDDDDDDERFYEYARVGRRRGRWEAQGSGSDNDDASAYRSRRRTDDGGRNRRGGNVDYVDGDNDELFDADYDDDDEYEEGILVPSPLLDSIDPEGASDRLGELVSDPKWWKDMALIAFVCLVVYVKTYDIDDLIPWDTITVDDFDLKAMYGPP